MSGPHRIGGLHFSTPFRSLLQPQFELLAQCGAAKPVLFGKSIWQMEHKQTPACFSYIASVEPLPAKVIGVAKSLQAALTDKNVECVPHARFNAMEVKFRHNTRPVSVFLFHAYRPDDATVIEAAPDSTAGAVMTQRQEILVSQGFIDLRHTSQNVVPLQRKQGSHAFSWLYG